MRPRTLYTFGHPSFPAWRHIGRALPLLCLVLCSHHASANTKPKAASTASSAIEIAATLADATKAVEEVASDPVVYGTYVYEHDKTLMGAHQADISFAFGNSAPEGKVFYKVAEGVISPRHFKDAEDSGTITVRYVLRAVNSATVSIRVDAVFIESARRVAHVSQGAVESAEFGQVQQHLNRIQAREKEAQEDAEAEARSVVAKAPSGSREGAGTKAPVNRDAATELPEPLQEPAPPTPVAADSAPPGPAVNLPVAPSGSIVELEQRVNQLRHQVEARIKQPGAPLKSAPFHTATTIQTVPGNAEVAVVILTPYWYGVQTTDGHTGWIQRIQLEPLP